MKRIIFYVVFLIVSIQGILAQIEPSISYQSLTDDMHVSGVWYVFKYTGDPIQLSVFGEKTHSWTAPGAELSFEAKRDAGDGGKLHVYQDSDEDPTFNDNPGTVTQTGVFGSEKTVDYKKYTKTLRQQTKSLRFYVSTGAWKKKYYKNVYVSMAQYLKTTATSLQFKDAENRDKYVVLDGTATTAASFAFDWCNVGEITVALKDNGVAGAANQYTVKVKNIDQADKSITGHNRSVSLGNSAGKWGNATIEVVYSHSKWGDHPAIVTVSAGTKSFDIQLTGKTLGYEQTLSWWTTDDPYVMIMDEVIEQTAVITSGTSIQYDIITTGGENYITLDATTGKLTSKAPTNGTQITIQASQAGNEYYAPATPITKKIEVSNKQRQDILWEQSFLGIKVSEDPSVYQRIPLTAEFTLSPVTYTSSDETVARIEGNATDGYELVILNVKGRATITAYQAGNDDYIPATATKELRVSDGKRGCEELVAYKDYESLFTIQEGEEIPIVGVPHQVTFEGASDEWNLGLIPIKPSGDLKLRQYCYRDGSWNWYDVTSEALTIDVWNVYGPYDLDETATKIQFYTVTGATCYHNYRNVKVIRKRFMKTTTTGVTFSSLPVGSSETRSVVIEYSNIPTALVVEIQNDAAGYFSTVEKTLGTGCGETGTATIQVVYNPQAMGTHTAELVIRDPEPEKETAENRINEIRIPLAGAATKKFADITWDQVWNDPKTIDKITFTASATAGLPITYSQTEESKAVATVDATTGELTILQAGTIRVFADAAGNGLYEPATQVVRDFTIRTTNYTVENIVVEAIARGHQLSEVVLTADVKDEAGDDLIDGYTYMWDTPEQIMIDAADHSLMFTPNKVNFYAPATTKTVNIVVTYRNWLSIVPDNVSANVLPTETEYTNMLYWELDDALTASVSATDTYTTLSSGEDISVKDAQYMLLSAEADTWRSFVAPMDVEKAYVIELTPEPTADMEAEATRTDMLAKQTAANKAFYDYIKATLDADDKRDLLALIDEYLTQLCTANGYTKQTEVGIYPLEHYDGSNAWTYTYYLYESAPTWVLDGDGFAKDWTPVAASGDIMQRGKTYAINFPYCLDCDNYKGWDYWTGKLILLEHTGEQTIQGQHAADKYAAPNPAATMAEHAGNAYFADVQSGSNAYMHDVASDTYKLVANTAVRPTTSVLYASIPAKQGKRAVAISRQGEIIWEDDAADGGDGGTVTGLDGVAETTLHVMAQEGGFSVLSSTVQALQIYGIDGRLVYTGTIEAGEAQFFSVTAGMYVLRTQTETRKVMAR